MLGIRLWVTVLMMMVGLSAVPYCHSAPAPACISVRGEYVKPQSATGPGYAVTIKQTGCSISVAGSYLSTGKPTEWSPADGVVTNHTVAVDFSGNHLVGKVAGRPLHISFGAVVWVVDQTQQCVAPPDADSSCSLAGTWWFGTRATTMTISLEKPPHGAPLEDLFYSVAPDPNFAPGWSTASMQLVPLPSASRQAKAGWKWSFTMIFHPGSTFTGTVDDRCSIIEWDGSASIPWCNSKCTICKGPPVLPPANVSLFWGGPNAEVHLIEVSHSDIYWLGQADDMRIDSAEIASALDLMATHPQFKWNHECILFVRAFIEFFPEREAEMVQRLQQKQLDFGATFSQPFEAPQYNEVLIRQLYEGRKWFVERYPEVDSARVAFQQDSPAKSLQSLQILNKSGIPFLKASRIGEAIFNWASPDGSTTLAFEQVDYAELASLDSATLLTVAEQYLAQFLDSGAPPLLPVATGSDYTMPSIRSNLEEDWMNVTGPAVWPNRSNGPPPLRYSTVHEYLQRLQQSPGFSPRTMRGERPSLWFAESSCSHHRMFTFQRHAGRNLPGAEMFSTFRAMIEGHWGSYPDAELAEAWLNVTLADHGIGGELTPYSMPCRGGQELNKSRPYTPFLCNLVRPQTPGKADVVYTLKYEHAAVAADRLMAAAQQWIAGLVVHSGGKSNANVSNANVLVVFNQLSWTRDDPVTVLLPPSLALSERSLVLKDSAGAVVPSQRINRTAFVFVARAVPSLGYASYTVDEAPGTGRELPPSMPRVGTTWTTPFENEYYIISPGKGGLSQIVDKTTGTEIFDTSKLLAGEWMSLAYTATGSSETRTYRHAGNSAGGSESGTPTFDQATMGMQRLGNLSGWQRWSCIESGGVRVVFRSSPVPTRCSTVTYDLTVYMALKRIDYTVHLADWQDCFGVTNRLVFPIHTAERNVSYATNFAGATVGMDEVEDESRWVTPGAFDTWLENPAPSTPAFERGWRMGPRECLDWFHAEATGGVSVMVGSSVGLFDWTDRAELYGPNEVVLAPELLMHTNLNAGPSQNETGNHSFDFSIFVTAAGWRNGWKEAVGSRTPLTATWKSALDTQYGSSDGDGDSDSGGGGGSTATNANTARLPMLPSRASFLELDNRHLWVSTVKREQPLQRRWQDCPPEQSFTCAPKANGVVVRLFDQTGLSDSTTAELRLMFGITRTQHVNLLELDPVDIHTSNSTDNHTARVTVGHHAIETLRLDMGIARSSKTSGS